MDQLPAFIAYTIGVSLASEFGLLIGFVVLLAVRREMRRKSEA